MYRRKTFTLKPNNTKGDTVEVPGGPYDYMAVIASSPSASPIAGLGAGAAALLVSLLDAGGNPLGDPDLVDVGDVIAQPFERLRFQNPLADTVTATVVLGTGVCDLDIRRPVFNDVGDGLLVTPRPLASGDWTLFQDLVGAGATQLCSGAANTKGILVGPGTGWAKGTGALNGVASLFAADGVGGHAFEIIGAYCGVAATDRGWDSNKSEWFVPAGFSLNTSVQAGSIISLSFKKL